LVLVWRQNVTVLSQFGMCDGRHYSPLQGSGGTCLWSYPISGYLSSPFVPCLLFHCIPDH